MICFLRIPRKQPIFEVHVEVTMTTHSLQVVLYELNTSSLCNLVSRPSKTCKSPYVADGIVQDGHCNEPVSTMIHTPSLGCCGLVEAGSSVIVTKIPEKKTGKEATCKYRTELAVLTDGHRKICIGVNPKLAENIVEKALISSNIQGLILRHTTTYAREKTFLNSRFDFAGTDADGREFILEVKNVPLADYVDVPKKEKKKALREIHCPVFDEKIAYFPDGYRKSGNKVVSPRALKHIQELETIAKTGDYRAILCFVIQRPDVAVFQPSKIDPTYREAVQQAWMSGVEIKTLQVTWSESGKCVFMRNDLPIRLFDVDGPQPLHISSIDEDVNTPSSSIY